MKDAVAELFDFASPPGTTQVRQFFTGVSNVLFGMAPNWDGTLSATGDVAEMSGHSAATHQASYSSSVVGGRESMFDKFHQGLGCEASSCTSPQMTGSDLLKGLRFLHGQTAGYTSKAQEEMVLLMANSTTRHAHFGLPCGAGKSSAWLVPTVSRALAGNGRQTIIVVVPYKFLMECHTKAAIDKVGSLDISVLSFAGNEIRESAPLPVGLRDSNSMPHILFLSLEGMVHLVRYHPSSLKHWVEEKIVKRIILDEMHTILGEGFRTAYEHLSSLASFGVPVATMSGTIPRPFLPPLLKYLRLSTDDGDVDIVDVKDCIGTFPPTFKLVVTMEERALNLAVNALRMLSRQHPDHGIHVMVAGKASGDRIVSALSPDILCRFVSSDTPQLEQTEVAKDWSEGRFQILVSTTIALVGNENEKCRHVFIVGLLFSLMNVIQAIGRLRPSQRVGGASVRIFVQPQTETRLVEYGERDSQMFTSLLARKLINDDRDSYMRVASVLGLHSWLSDNNCCRIRKLGELYGFVRQDCGFCDVCRGSTTQRLALVARSKMTIANRTMNSALLVLKRLSDKCLYCLSSRCNGESCMGQHDCYRCGGAHFLSQCRYKSTAKSVLDGKACFDCFDLYARSGYSNHNKERCPLQRRLRRLVFARCRETKQEYATFMSSVFSEAATFYSFVDSFSATT